MIIGMTSSWLALLSVFCTLWCSTVVEAQATASPNPTGLFGQLEYHQSSGDVVGLEVFIVKGQKGYVAIVQVAEGVPMDPIVVPIKFEGPVLSFEMRSGKETLRYGGTI